MGDLHTEAVAGLCRGWAFTPLDGKVPILPRWQHRPPPTSAMVARWIASGYNLGLRTGLISGVAVIDFDGGADVDHGQFPRTVTAITGSGGWHLYYRCSRPVPNTVGRPRPDGSVSRKAIAANVDTRGDGGQVVFVGSRHPGTGRLYRWARGLSPDDVPLAEFPHHLLPGDEPKRIIAPPPIGQPPDQLEKRAIAYVDKCEPAISGQGGHNATFRVACKCFQFGLDAAAAWRVMQRYNARCQPPWSERELDHKIRSARRRVMEDGEFGSLAVTNDDIPELVRF